MNVTAHEIDRLIPRWGGPTNQYPTLGVFLVERLHDMRFLRSSGGA